MTPGTPSFRKCNAFKTIEHIQEYLCSGSRAGLNEPGGSANCGRNYQSLPFRTGNLKPGAKPPTCQSGTKRENGTKCYKMGRNVTECYKMLHSQTTPKPAFSATNRGKIRHFGTFWDKNKKIFPRAPSPAHPEPVEGLGEAPFRECAPSFRRKNVTPYSDTRPESRSAHFRNIDSRTHFNHNCR